MSASRFFDLKIFFWNYLIIFLTDHYNIHNLNNLSDLKSFKKIPRKKSFHEVTYGVPNSFKS